MLTIKIKVPKDEVKKFQKETRRKIRKAMGNAMRQILKDTLNIQIKSYRANKNPPKPEGSKYRRTFKMRRSGKKKTTSTKLELYEGEVFTDGSAIYDEIVIGPESKQAGIHIGRWKSEEEQTEIGQEQGEKTVQKEIDKLK